MRRHGYMIRSIMRFTGFAVLILCSKFTLTFGQVTIYCPHLMGYPSYLKTVRSYSPILMPMIQINDKMKEAIQSDCTKYALGIEIINVCLTKQNIPSSTKRNLEQMEEERTKGYFIIFYLLSWFINIDYTNNCTGF